MVEKLNLMNIKPPIIQRNDSVSSFNDDAPPLDSLKKENTSFYETFFENEVIEIHKWLKLDCQMLESIQISQRHSPW